MLEITLRHTRLCLDFSFFAVIALFLLTDREGFGLMALSACVLHESAHFAAMTAFGVPVQRLTFYGAGIRIKAGSPARQYQRAVILGAGCAANFAAALCFLLARDIPLCAVNLFTGAFNLLPLGELDGAALLKLLAIKRFRAENIDRIMRGAGIASALICAGAAAAAAASGGKVSVTLVTTALYLLILGSRDT